MPPNYLQKYSLQEGTPMEKEKNNEPDFNKVLFHYWKLLIDEKDQKDKEVEDLKNKLARVKKKNQKFKDEMVESSIFERWKIGEYLHDDLAQTLVSAKMMVSQLKNKFTDYKNDIAGEVNDIVNVIDKSIRGARDLSHDVIPLDVKEEGISQALRLLELQTKRRDKVDVTLETDDVINKINNRRVATNIYHIAQEAIKNAVNHGEARNVKIAVIEHERKLYLHVKDDGKGFESSDKTKGMGINIMKHRTEEMGGSFRIGKEKAEQGQYNTCVTCKLPVDVIKENSDDI